MQDDLIYKLERVSHFVDIEKVVELQPDPEYINSYYRVNKIPYSLFHTRTGLIHMGISRDGRYKESDLLEAVRMIAKYIEGGGGRNILELATGRGANSGWLAQQFPDASFYGIDTSLSQLMFAAKRSKSIPNLQINASDYHQLQDYQDAFFDLVFVIESLCYSENKERVVSEVLRVLKPGGLFIIFDGYSAPGRNNSSRFEEQAAVLFEKGMAVSRLEEYTAVKEKMLRSGFIVIHEENLSQYTLPTLRIFARKAERVLRYTFLADVIFRFFPQLFTLNIVTGYVAPNLIEQGIISYWMTVTKKPE